jgi:hypothetical protein
MAFGFDGKESYCFDTELLKHIPLIFSESFRIRKADSMWL